MSKTKATKVAKGADKTEKTLTKVKDAGVTKPSQTPKAKGKDIARKVAVKEEKTQKKNKKKAPSPSSSDSESDSDEEMKNASSSSSESESEDEKPAKKETKKATKESAKAKPSESSSESESEESSSEEEAPKKTETKKAEPKKAASDSESESESASSESSESEDEAPAKAKQAEPAKKTNGVKKDASESEEESESSEESGSGSDSESESESESEATEESAKESSKKRKADDEQAPAAKKSKTQDIEGASANLFVGNLSWNVDEDWLRNEFDGFGELTGVRIVTERETGRSRGFGYVEFANVADAVKAYKAKKDAEVDGRKINLDYANSRPSNNDGGNKDRAQNRARSFGDQTSPESDTLFIGNLPFSANEDAINEVFADKGSILGIRLPTDPDSGRPKGFGYIQFSSVDEARQALNDLQGADLEGRSMRLDFSTPRQNNGDSGRGGGRGGFGDRGGRGGRGRGGRGGRGRGGFGGGRGGPTGANSTNRGGVGEFQGKKITF